MSRYVPNLINEFWQSLPDEVKSNKLVSRAGVPTVGTKVHFLVSASELLTQALVKGGAIGSQKHNRATASDGEAESIRNSLEAQTSLIIAYSRWMTVLDQERPRRGEMSIDTISKLARDLSRDSDPHDLEPDTAQELGRQAIHNVLMEKQAVTANADELRRNIAAERDALNTRIESVWAAGRNVPRAALVRGPDQQQLEARILGGVTWQRGDDLRVVATRDAELAWNELVESFGDDGGECLAGLGKAEPQVPALTGKVTDETGSGTPGYPLDRHVHGRLYRVLKAGAVSGPTTSELLALTIDASVLPYGLPAPWARAAIHIGQVVAHSMPLTTVGASASTPPKTPIETETIRRLQNRWASTVARYAGNGSGSQPHNGPRVDYAASADDFGMTTPTIGRFRFQNYSEDPSAYMIGRLWTRLLRANALSSAQMSVAEMWSEIYGAWTSTHKMLPSVFAWTAAAPRDGSASSRIVFRVAEAGYGQLLATVWRRVVDLEARKRTPVEIVHLFQNWCKTFAEPDEATPTVANLRAYMKSNVQLLQAIETRSMRDGFAESNIREVVPLKVV